LLGRAGQPYIPPSPTPSQPSTHPPPLIPPGKHSHLATKERLLVCWFLCTGLIHLVVEGWVVAVPGFFRDTSKNILSEICESELLPYPTSVYPYLSGIPCVNHPARPTNRPPLNRPQCNHPLPPPDPQPTPLTPNRRHPPGKEYAKADSRYATRDDFVISMEAVTAFVEGPGCFLIVWALCARKAWRYAAVVLVSLGQLYGDVLYFLTCLHGGESRRRGEV
jgi:hypothetical protein